MVSCAAGLYRANHPSQKLHRMNPERVPPVRACREIGWRERDMRSGFAISAVMIGLIISMSAADASEVWVMQAHGQVSGVPLVAEQNKAPKPTPEGAATAAPVCQTVPGGDDASLEEAPARHGQACARDGGRSRSQSLGLCLEARGGGRADRTGRSGRRGQVAARLGPRPDLGAPPALRGPMRLAQPGQRPPTGGVWPCAIAGSTLSSRRP